MVDVLIAQLHIHSNNMLVNVLYGSQIGSHGENCYLAVYVFQS